MSTLIGVVVVVGLCIWILVDISLIRRRKLAAPPPVDPREAKAEQMKQGRVFMIGFGMATYAMAYNEWMHPSRPPFSGRFSSLFLAIYQNFGPQAVSFFWILVGTAFVLIGFLMKANAQSPKASLRADASRQ